MSAPLLDSLAEIPLIAVLRGLDTAAAVTLCHAITAAGVRAVEITMDSPDAATSIAALRDALARDVAVGAGTVVTAENLRLAVRAGASFCVAPHLDEAVVAAGRAEGVAVIPGIATPTELHRAVVTGAAMVKLFPAGALGHDYLHALRGPYPEVPVMVSGGVAVDDIAAWIRAGATAIGLGAGTLCDAATARRAVAAAIG